MLRHFGIILKKKQEYMKKIALGFLLCLIIVGCKKHEEKMPVIEKKEDILIDRGIVQDSLALLKKLHVDDFETLEDLKIKSSLEMNLYGSDEPIVFIETNFTSNSLIDYAGKKYFALDKSDKVILEVLGNEYSLETIFSNQKPFLVVTEITVKNNGIHHFYGLEKGNLKDYLDTKGWSIQTIGRKDAHHDYEPNVLPLTFEDTDEDGMIEAVFTGHTINTFSKKMASIQLIFEYDSIAKEFKLQ